MKARVMPGTGEGEFEVALTLDLAGIQLVQREGKWEGAINLGLRTERVTPAGVDFAKPSVHPVPLSLTDAQLQEVKARGLVIRQPVSTGGSPSMLRVVVQDPASGAIGSLRVPLAP